MNILVYIYVYICIYTHSDFTRAQFLTIKTSSLTFHFPAEACFTNSLIAALLCRVEYNPFLPVIPSLCPFLSLLVFLSALPSSLLLHPVWLLSLARWNAMSLWSSLHYLWLCDARLSEAKGPSWCRSVASIYKRPLHTRLNSRLASRLH